MDGHDVLVQVMGFFVETSFHNDVFYCALGVLAGGYGSEVAVSLCVGVGGSDHF